MKNNDNFNLIRLLAAFQVLVVHSLNHFDIDGLMVGLIKLFPGVPIFFFISGMLITGAWERITNSGVGLFKFWKHRVLRIFPALWVCVFFSVLLVAFLGYFDGKLISVPHFISWIFGQTTIFQFYNPDFMRGFGTGVLNGALWTISVELQFYLLTPLIFFILRKNIILFFILMLVSLLFNVYLRLSYDWSDMRIKLLSVSFVPWLYMFMTGALFYVFRERMMALIRVSTPMGLFALYLLSMILIGSYKQNAQNSINPVSFFILAGFILWLSKVKLIWPKSFLSIVQRNDISYGVYLYHMPIINGILYVNLFPEMSFLRVISVIFLTMSFGAASWHLIERPALNLKSKW